MMRTSEDALPPRRVFSVLFVSLDMGGRFAIL